MQAPKKLFIVEDHTILREGLKALLSAKPEWEIVGEAGEGDAAIRGVEKLQPDLVLMDLSLPKMNGTEAIREIKRRCPNTKIVTLTVHKTEEYISAAFEAGAEGYVLKDATHGELELAIRNVLSGKKFISPGISEKIVAGYLQKKKTESIVTPWDTLTPRERSILKLIAEGYKNKEIADYLCISVKTVEKHRSNLMQKLDLHNVSDLTAYAIAKGLVTR